nr:hypothetical protein [uncultured Rhodoferax sp.]
MQTIAHPSTLRASLFCAMAFASSLLWAQPSGSQTEHRGPPKEALEACKASKSGQDCSFTSPRGAVNGSYFAPEGKPLACRPKDAPKK